MNFPFQFRMTKRFNKKNIKEYPFLVDYLNDNNDMDFYYTDKNTRYYITDEKSLKQLFKNSEYIYTIEEKGNCVGIVLRWKSIGGDKKRYYVKLNADDEKIAKKLLTALLWNCKCDLHIKIRKNSRFLKVFKQKGFKFQGGRGIQLLLKRKFIKQVGEKKSEFVRH